MRRPVRVRFRSFGVVILPKYYAVGIAFLCILAVIWFAGTSVLRVKNITCTYSNASPCDEIMIAELQKITGTPLYAVRFDRIEQRLKTAMPDIKTLQLSIHPPAEVRVVAELHQPAFLLHSATGSATLVVSDFGTIVRTASQDDLQTIHANFEYPEAISLQIGTRLDGTVHRSLLSMAQALSRSSLPIDAVKVEHANKIVLSLNSGMEAVVDGVFAESQLSALQQLLNTATIKELGAHRIDVRFAHPVLQ